MQLTMQKMRYKLIILFTVFALHGLSANKKKKIRKLEHELQRCEILMQSKGVIKDTVYIYPTKRKIKAKTKRLKQVEKTKRTALELESKVLELEKENERLRIKKAPKIHKQKEKNKTKRNFVFQFFSTVKTLGWQMLLAILGSGISVWEILKKLISKVAK